MYEIELKKIFSDFKKEKITESDVIKKLKYLPFENIGVASLDNHRVFRKKFPEIVFGEKKSSQQIKLIAEKFFEKKVPLIITRVNKEHIKTLKKKKNFIFHKTANIISFNCNTKNKKGKIVVVTAGTADIPVAEESSVTCELLGNRVERLYDVGVSGIHRLLMQLKIFENSRCVICIAGMEGALPSVVAGIVSQPVIAVPTSVGYGASFGGVTALLAMLNSCSNGISVVNIDNGFGAAYQAHLINNLEFND